MERRKSGIVRRDPVVNVYCNEHSRQTKGFCQLENLTPSATRDLAHLLLCMSLAQHGKALESGRNDEYARFRGMLHEANGSGVEGG